jgi:hypothetical protein
MLRHFLTSVAVIAAGAVTAAILHLAAPVRVQAQSAHGFCGAALESASHLFMNPSRLPAVLHEAVRNTVTAVAPGLDPVDPAKTATVLLNQPVAVLEKDRGVWTELPEGTSVQVLGSQGRFVQVRHAERVITIPRSALQLGIVKTN